MCNSEKNQLTCQKIFLLNEPVWRAVYYASRVHVPDRVCRLCLGNQTEQKLGTYQGERIPFIARIGRVRNSASGCTHSQTDWNAGVYVRNLPSTCLCLRPLGSRELSGCRPHGAR